MRALRFLNIAVLSVLVGGAAIAYAQEEKPQEEKPAHQEEAKPQPKQEEAKPSKPQDKEVPKQQDERRGKEQATPDRQERPETQTERPAQGQGRPETQNERSTQGQEHPQMEGDHAGQGQGRPEQRAENGRPAGKGGHIPDDKFRSQFGRGHHFNARSVIVSGQPQFQYGGYTFSLIDAWPADWAYTDDCYIDYVDGEYFLFDVLHPGVRVAVYVVM